MIEEFKKFLQNDKLTLAEQVKFINILLADVNLKDVVDKLFDYQQPLRSLIELKESINSNEFILIVDHTKILIQANIIDVEALKLLIE